MSVGSEIPGVGAVFGAYPRTAAAASRRVIATNTAPTNTTAVTVGDRFRPDAYLAAPEPMATESAIIQPRTTNQNPTADGWTCARIQPGRAG